MIRCASAAFTDYRITATQRTCSTLQEIKAYMRRRVRCEKRICGTNDMNMNLYNTAGLTLAANALAGGPWSAETRITYLSASRNQLMRDDSRLYALTDSAEVGKVAMGQRVELKLGGVGGKRLNEIDTIL